MDGFRFQLESILPCMRYNHVLIFIGICNMQTHRPTVESLENILYTPIPVLDHGFIRVIDYMGNDCSIVEAARVSYGQNHQTSDPIGIRRLLRYLMRHHHTTPFEMCDIKFHIKLPIFVARQWIRHRTASVNEYSARYSILSQEFYLPNPETICPQSTTNNQGREEGVPLRNPIVRLFYIFSEAMRNNVMNITRI